MTRYETPDALRHDAHTLADDARSLIEATAEATDERIAEARKRLAAALAAGKQNIVRVQEKASLGAQAVDQSIRSNPYQSIAVAFGVGALLGYLITRRD